MTEMKASLVTTLVLAAVVSVCLLASSPLVPVVAAATTTEKSNKEEGQIGPVTRDAWLQCFLCHLTIETKLQASLFTHVEKYGNDEFFCEFIPAHVGTAEQCHIYLNEYSAHQGLLDRYEFCNKQNERCVEFSEFPVRDLFEVQVTHISNALAQYAFVTLYPEMDASDRDEILLKKYFQLPQSAYPGYPRRYNTYADQRNDANYIIGTGVYDITGPVAEIVFFGYADSAMTGHGLHHRLRTRAYHIGTVGSDEFVVIVQTDLWAAGQHIKTGVTQMLSRLYPKDYSDENIMISCTHTHSGPGGYDAFIAYNIVAKGFNGDNYDTIVNGIVEAIVRARENSRPGSIFVNVGDVLETTVNRALEGYVNNPQEERDAYGIDRDETMMLLKFVDNNGTELGSINWHAAHAVSMKNTNRHVSSDNKGLASYMFEQAKGAGDYSKVDVFAAGFSQSNAGDISPNTGGCGKCGPKDEYVGEGETDLESSIISATRQFEKALELYESATEELNGALSFRTSNVDFRDHSVAKVNATTTHGAFGYSMVAGTRDGWVLGEFAQGWTEVIPIVEFVSKLFYDYDDVYKESQGPKPILLPTGLATFFGINIPLTPQILQLQIFQIGQLAVIGFPSEITTMAGRRVREAVLKALSPIDVKYATISALTNGYCQYVTTPEEYEIQWFEAASTHFTKHTLDAYIQEYERIAAGIRDGVDVDPGPKLPRMFTVEVFPKAKPDQLPDDVQFGDVIQDTESSYSRGDHAIAYFYGANPRHNFRTQDTFLKVESYLGSDDQWEVVATDSSIETKFHWSYQDDDRSTAISIVGVEWSIPDDVPAGTYRLRYFGDRLLSDQETTESIFGTSSTFTIN